jgi:hypothetical protein
MLLRPHIYCEAGADGPRARMHGSSGLNLYITPAGIQSRHA